MRRFLLQSNLMIMVSYVTVVAAMSLVARWQLL